MTAVSDTRTETTEVISIQPLQPTIGAEISGVDLSKPISDSVRDQIKQAIWDYKVVFFRDQFITHEQHVAFGERFGVLYTRKSVDDDPRGVIEPIRADAFVHFESTPDGWDYYHTDTSWRFVPVWGAILRAVDIPEYGGDTVWTDTTLSYDKLTEEQQEIFSKHYVIHDTRHVRPLYPIQAHPMVRTHRESGKKFIWVNFGERPWIVGLDRSESQELLKIVHDIYRRPENQVRFAWRPGSIAFWDERSTVHYAVRNYQGYPRLLERVLIQDTAEYAND